MLDLKFIQANLDLVRENTRKRGYDVDIDRLVALDRERRRILTETEALRAEAKKLAKSAPDPAGGLEERRARGVALKDQVAANEAELAKVQAELDDLLTRVPNLLDPRVPAGGEESATLVREWGTPAKPDFEPQSHEVLGERLNMIDIDRGVRVAGSRFYLLKNDGVLLRHAMTQLFLSLTAGKGWEIVSPPYLASEKTLFTAGYLPFADKDNYRIEGTDLSLIGTSEQALLGMHMDEILTKLPLLYLGESMCFRTEAGSAGRDTKGVIRVHQFFKLEQIIYSAPEESEKYHLVALENEERFLQALEIPYRVIVCATEDTGAPGRMKYDTEAWFPSQQRYREVTSNTNLGDFQTRRGNIRYKGPDGQRVFPHTISATGFCDRHILAVMENYQQADGTIAVPAALAPYMHGKTVLKG